MIDVGKFKKYNRFIPLSFFLIYKMINVNLDNDLMVCLSKTVTILIRGDDDLL